MSKITRLTVTQNGIPVPNAELITSLYSTKLYTNEDGYIQANLDDDFAQAVDIDVIVNGVSLARASISFEAGGEYTISI